MNELLVLLRLLFRGVRLLLPILLLVFFAALILRLIRRPRRPADEEKKKKERPAIEGKARVKDDPPDRGAR